MSTKVNEKNRTPSDLGFISFVKQSRRNFDHSISSLNQLSRQIEIGFMKALYPDNLILDSKDNEKIDEYDYGLILNKVLSPFFTSISEEPLSTTQLKELVETMLEKYELLKQFAKNNLLSDNLVSFVNNLTTEQVLVLLSDNGPGMKEFMNNMPDAQKQMYLAVAAAVDSIHITQLMMKPQPDGHGIIPDSNATTLSFLATKVAIPASFLTKGGAPKLSGAIMNASHMLNKNALVLLRDAYKENVDTLIQDGTTNALVAAMTSNFTGTGSTNKRDVFLEDLLQIKRKPSLIDAKIALNQGFENIVRQYLEQSSEHESEQLIQSANKMGKGDVLVEIMENLHLEKEYSGTAMR